MASCSSDLKVSCSHTRDGESDSGIGDREHDINRTFTLDLDEPLSLSSTSPPPASELPQLPYCAKHGRSLPSQFLLDDTGTQGVGRAVHNCTALNAAVILGQVERVKALLASGASMSVEDCTGSTAVSEAAYHNQVEVMKLLLDSGADVDTPNRFGLTPLCIASSSYKAMGMVTLLLKRGANVNLKAKDGRSALHLAAEGGHRWIAKKLLQCESLDLESICLNSSDNAIFCPSPLLLAASEGHVRVMEMMLRGYAHPLPSIIDAYLVLWAVFNLDIAPVKSPSDCDSYCRHALKMREESNQQVQHSNTSEMKSTTEFDELLTLGKTECEVAKAHQSLIILERCLGPHTKLLAKAFKRAASVLARQGNLLESEHLLAKALDVMACEERELMKRGIYKLPIHLHVVVTSMMESLWKFWGKHKPAVGDSDHHVNFVLFIRRLLKVLDVLLQLKSKQVCGGLHSQDETFQDELVHLLTLISCSRASYLFFGVSVHQEELEQIGQAFVEQYRDYCSQYFTSLVHLAVSKVDVVVNGMRQVGVSSGDLGEDGVVLLRTLLQWGSLNDLNTPYTHIYDPGERLLHRAVLWANMDPCLLSLVDLFLSHGAHSCTANHKGQLPSQLSNRAEVLEYFQPLLLSPLPLTCSTSKVIVTSGIDYRSSLFIPPHLKRFIGHHDFSLIQSLQRQE